MSVEIASGAAELVVLLDPDGRPTAAATKSSVHHAQTPYHLAFSCHVVDADGRVLLTRRSANKRTWPGVWSNACCGHPAPGETIRAAVERRLWDELHLRAADLAVAIGDFTYRAVMDNGVIEHELCPVVVARVAGVPRPILNRGEVDAVEWITWPALVERARERPASLSPWSVDQTLRLATLAPSPLAFVERDPAVLFEPRGFTLDAPVLVPDSSSRMGD